MNLLILQMQAVTDIDERTVGQHAYAFPCKRTRLVKAWHSMNLLILQMQAVTDIDERTLKWHQQLQGRWYYGSSALR